MLGYIQSQMGFDANIFGSLIAMINFKDDFSSGDGATEGLIASRYVISNMILGHW
jgi:hypothetical protein